MQAALDEDVALLRERWPHVPWSRVSFRLGLPWWARRGRPWAMVVPDPLGVRRLRVHVSPALLKLAPQRRQAILVHEVVHVLQYQRHWGGRGWGYLRPFVLAYLMAYPHAGASRRHPMEEEAYAAEGRGIPPAARFTFRRVAERVVSGRAAKAVLLVPWALAVTVFVAAAQLLLAAVEVGARLTRSAGP